MSEYGHSCGPNQDCTLPNIHCAYPDCYKGKQDALIRERDALQVRVTRLEGAIDRLHDFVVGETDYDLHEVTDYVNTVRWREAYAALKEGGEEMSFEPNGVSMAEFNAVVRERDALRALLREARDMWGVCTCESCQGIREVEVQENLSLTMRIDAALAEEKP